MSMESLPHGRPDTSYSLWEDDAWEHPDAVAKMAIEIIKMSDPGRETEQD